MSLLEKVIYVADYISADRTYSDVETMRRLAQESLEEAMLYALKFCITKLAHAGQVIHTNSVDCYNELLIEKVKHTADIHN
jgi:nicotinate-nucleotide adenylyltransferase